MKSLWHVFIGLSLTACGASHAESAPAAKADAIPVTLAPVVQAPADAPLRATGRVSHARDLEPAFKTGGVVKEVLADEGDRVTRGQVLARLDTREIDAGMAQARAALHKAERDLARVGQLVDEAVLPATTREDAGTAATVARAQLAGLAFDRETATLVATADGVVVKRLAEPGEVVGPGMPVLVIGESAADRFEIEVGVPSRELARIAVGTQATVRLDGDVTERAAEVIELAPTLTPGTDRLAVTLAVMGVAPRGLVGTATFAPRAGVMLPAVPLTTLVEGLGREAAVWLPDPGRPDRVVRRPVTIARIDPSGKALIASGLDGVGAVIDAGSAWLDADATVVIRPAAGEAKTTAEVGHEAR